jgi:hypothetical protein
MFWLDHGHPFGCTSSTGNHGEVGDFTEDCWAELEVGPVRKWVDDFVVFRFPISGDGSLGDPYLYLYDRESMLAKIESLGIPWHKSKGQDFDSSFVYLGFHWDLASKTVSLTDEKRLKFKGRVDDFLRLYENSQAPIDAILSLNGSLSHIAFVYPRGRSFLPNISAFTSSFPSNFHHRYPPKSVISDLKWWSRTLAISDWKCSLRPRLPVQDIGLFVDASTSWGIGLILGSGAGWDAWALTDKPRSPFQHIGWLEAVAVELALHVLVARGVHSSHILIYSDNQGVIGAWNRGRGRNPEINLSIRRAELLAHEHAIALSFNFVDSEDNLADPISRGILGPVEQHLASSFPLPVDLRPFLRHV